VAYFRIFGCRAWVHNNKGKKLDAKAPPMTFVGYEPGSKAYRLWDPLSHKIVISSDVTFDETLFPHLPAEKPDPVKTTEPRVLRPRSEGKQVKFVDIPLNVFEEGDYGPSLPKKKRILRHRASTVGSSPDTPGQAPQPASPPAPPRPPTPSSSHPPERPSTPVQDRWRTAFEDPSDDERDVEKDLFNFGNDELPFPPKLDNLAMDSKLSSSSSSESSVPNSPVATPSSAAFSLPSYHSPEPESLYSDSEFETEPRHSERKQAKQINYVVSDDDMVAFDEAYAEGVKLYISSATDRGEPRSYREATSPKNPDSEHWIEAIQTELKSLQDHGTWELVPRPEGKHIVSCKWVWRIKIREDGSVERYKARLVARGFTQTRGVDFNETFAPVTRLDNLWLLIANAVENDWEFRQIEVKTAYLYTKLDEEVYMEAPEGLTAVPDGYCCRLIRALYGLRQAGRQWYHELSGVMKKFGMKRIPSDPHTFIATKVVKKKECRLILPVYVDDLFPFGDKALTDDFENWIPKYFETSTPCDAHYLLGIQITRNRNPPPGVQPWISLDQVTFTDSTITAISKSFQEEISIRHTVLPVAEIVPNPLPKNLADASRTRRFQSTVGQLMYLMLATRPDIAYPVGMLAQHASNPSPAHENTLLHLVGYIKHTKDYTLTYSHSKENASHWGQGVTYPGGTL